MADARGWVGRQVLARVAGPDGADRHERIFAADGRRWFAEDRPIRRVHGDASMFVGGLRALLLQSLHPLAMAGVAGHSDFRHDPWGRLQRTSFFLAVTTFGPDHEAARAVARVRGVHRTVHGRAADGRPYTATDPHLLRWVHVAEVDSFLLAHTRYGSAPLDRAGRDGYVADTAVVAAELGVIDPPTTEAELARAVAEFRPELAAGAEAREAARYLLVEAPIPWAAAIPYGLLGTAAVGMMPAWSRAPLGLPHRPRLEATVGRLGGRLVTSVIRWATSAAPADPPPGRVAT